MFKKFCTCAEKKTSLLPAMFLKHFIHSGSEMINDKKVLALKKHPCEKRNTAPKFYKYTMFFGSVGA